MPSTPTRVRSLTRPFLVKVLEADPNFQQEKKRQPEYEFSGKTFYADPSKRGAYAPEE
jgi:hypothetical protein